VSSTDAQGLTTDLAGLPALAGRDAGHTDWETMEQARVDLFADATDDHQYIHVDPERAKDSPFGGTVAHGYLTLSLVAPVLGRLLTVTDARTGVNYGLDRVRFPAPLRVGARWRGAAQLQEVTEISGGAQMKVGVTIEIEGSERPAMVAEVLVRVYA
jgi:acyl dehydratase